MMFSRTLVQRCGSRGDLVGRVPLRCVRIRRPTSPGGWIRAHIHAGLGFDGAAKQNRGLITHTDTRSDLKSLQLGLFGMGGG